MFDAAGAGAGAAPAVAAAAAALADRPRRPYRSPRRTGEAAGRAVLDARDRFGWGPRKIHAFLLQEADRRGGPPPPGLPCARTVARVLARHGRVAPPAPPAAAQRFERAGPNDLWQLDHKGAVEVARRKVAPQAVVDDHSRYLLAFEPVPDKTMAAAWDVLWRVFGECGMPAQVLCDNAFGTMGTATPVGLSWFDARLIRLGVAPSHGRPYHPQTQGKCERLHGTAAREFIFFNARRDTGEHFLADCRAWRGVYNTLRPHEALGDRPPAERWRPSARARPAELPQPESFYPAGSEVRKVCLEGLVRVDGRRVLVGRGVGGQPVRVQRRGRELAILYCWKEVRTLSHDQLTRDRVL